MRETDKIVKQKLNGTIGGGIFIAFVMCMRKESTVAYQSADVR